MHRLGGSPFFGFTAPQPRVTPAKRRLDAAPKLLKDMDVLTMQDIIVEPPDEGRIVDPCAWFETPGPFEIEIGCGKGGFLIGRALARPDVRLLGIEWANKYFKYCADRLVRRRIGNVRVMRTDARYFVVHHLPPECVNTLHLYHPDPWPKKRHHKRRIMQPEFVDAAVKALVPGGKWLVQTDHQEYFELIHGMLACHQELVQIPWEQGDVDVSVDWAGTNYEIKYQREGRRIFRMACQRRQGAPESLESLPCPTDAAAPPRGAKRKDSRAE